VVYADTSFLFSVVLNDTNTIRAKTYLSAHPSNLALTSWQRCELVNAARLSVWRGSFSTSNATSAIAMIEAMLRAGKFSETALVWPELLEIAEEISAKHASSLGVRTLDLMHVAAATSIGAGTFLSFDERQLTLARNCGLRVPKL
jgi:predicted nucleic acid-binding protein